MTRPAIRAHNIDMEPTTPTKKAYRAGAVCPRHGFVHSRPKSSERSGLRTKVAALHGAACIYCAAPITGSELELDRIVDSCIYALANILPACKACNNARNRIGSTLGIVAQDTDRIRGAIVAASMQECRSPYAEDIREGIEKILANL